MRHLFLKKGAFFNKQKLLRDEQKLPHVVRELLLVAQKSVSEPKIFVSFAVCPRIWRGVMRRDLFVPS